MSWSAEVKGLEKTQKALADTIKAAQPDGKLDHSIKLGITFAYGLAKDYTHIDTATLRAAHRMQQMRAANWRIHIDPSVVNPKTGQKPYEYGVYEHYRGGDHAFYEQVFLQGDKIADVSIKDIRKNLPK